MKINGWMIISIVLAIALIIVLLTGKSLGVNANATYDAALNENEVGAKAVSFINSELLGGEGSVTLNSVSEKDAYYEVIVNYNGQDVPTYFSKDGNYFFPQIVPLNTSSVPSANSTVNISLTDSPVLGNENASVTIIEFSDFSCPFCAAASGQSEEMVSYMKRNDPSWEAPVPGIIRDYVETGKAKLVYKYNFGHTGGHNANLVGWCLNEQNLFWEFHDKAFADQSNVEDLSKMKNIAQSLGADMNALNSCLSSSRYDSRFQEESDQAAEAGVAGTPTFFVNGEKVEGAVSYTILKKTIDSELAKT